MSALASNLVLLIFVLLAALVLFFFGCPWLDAIGHPRLCYLFYGVLILVLLYARTGSNRRRRRPSRAED